MNRHTLRILLDVAAPALLILGGMLALGALVFYLALVL